MSHQVPRDALPSLLLVTIRSITFPVLDLFQYQSTRLTKLFNFVLEVVQQVGPDIVALLNLSRSGQKKSTRHNEQSVIKPLQETASNAAFQCPADTPPISPTFITHPGSGPLYGLLFDKPSPSRPRSPAKQDTSLSSGSEVILDSQFTGRTNLSHCYKPFVPEAAAPKLVRSCSAAFTSNPKESRIAAEFAGDNNQRNDDNWVDETETNESRAKSTKGRASIRVKDCRAGRRPVKFFGSRVLKLKHSEDQDLPAKQIENRAGLSIEDDCAIESGDDEDCDYDFIIMQQKRRRYQQ